MTDKSNIDELSQKKFVEYFERIARSKAYRKWSPKERAIMNRLMFGEMAWPYLPLCNQGVEAKSRDILTAALSGWAFEKEERTEGHKRLHLITMMFNDQFIDFDRPYISMIQIKRRVRAILKKVDLNAFVFIEFEPTIFPSGGKGKKRAFCCHVHGHCWSDDPWFTPENAVKGLNKRRVLKPVFGMPAVQIKAQPIHGETSIKKMAGYSGKLPGGVKKIVPHPSGSKREVNVYANKAGLRGKIALRCVELYSQFSVVDLTLATGEGSKLRSAWKKSLKAKTSKAKKRKSLKKHEVDRILKVVHKTYSELEPFEVV